jgi:hypothetical protein
MSADSAKAIFIPRAGTLSGPSPRRIKKPSSRTNRIVPAKARDERKAARQQAAHVYLYRTMRCKLLAAYNHNVFVVVSNQEPSGPVG